MTACPDTGTWRAWLDDETAIPAPETHLAGCGACARTVAELRSAAGFASRKMTVLSPAPRPVVTPPVEAEASPRGWLRRFAGAAAAVLLISVVAATPGGRALADSVLSVFRSQRIDILESTSRDLAMSGLVLGQLGEVDTDGLPEPTRVAGAREAEAESGLDIPDAFRGDSWLVISSGTVRWELDSQAITDYLAAHGSDVEVPSQIDGTVVVLERGAIVFAVSGPLDDPSLVLVRSGPVTAHTEGASLGETREFLLSLPGLPGGLVSQLRAIEDWESTLPLPVPVDAATGSHVDLDGIDAVEIDVDDLGSGLIWVDDDVVTAVAGHDPATTRQVAMEIVRG